MPHWKLTLAYNGTQFHGWQVQPELVTVQGVLAQALEQITGEEVLPQGAGRTDAGVHALAQVASFSLHAVIPAANLQRALNRILPPALRVLRAEVVPASFHARHSSRSKLYEYRIFERRTRSGSSLTAERVCSPFLASFVWDCRWPLHLEAMQRSATLLVGTQDFSAMAATSREPRDPPSSNVAHSSRPNPVKTIYSSAWTELDGLLVYRVCGSGFLHHMVRNLVGTMVDIGRGSLQPEDLPRILASRDRSQAGPTAPAGGLYLVAVEYPDAHESSASAPDRAASAPNPFAQDRDRGDGR